MLKYEKIIHTLTPEQKLELLTSTEKIHNRRTKNFELPVFGVTTTNEELSLAGFIAPRYQELAATWNPDLIKEAACEIAKLHIKEKSKNLLAVSAEKLGAENLIGFSDSECLNAACAKAFSDGANEGGFASVLCGIPDGDVKKENYRISTLTRYEKVLKESKSFAEQSEGNLSELLKDWKYEGMRISLCHTPSELVRSITEGAHLSIADGFDPVVVSLAAMEEYKKSAALYADGKISLAEFQNAMREGEILSPEKVDETLDDALDYLREIDGRLLKNPSCGEFRSVMHEVASESIVLLKNNHNVLPLSAKDTVTILGAAAEETIYNTKEEMSLKTSLDYFRDTEIHVAGYATGYLMDGTKDGPLLDKACELSSSAPVTIIYLSAKGDSLPENQLELLQAVSSRGIKIVAVVCAARPLNMDFLQYCDAVLLTGVNYDGSLEALVDILRGEINPSGHLVSPVKVLDTEYPVGYGLSYSDFEYKNFQLNKQCLTCTIENTGMRDGYTTLCMYVSNLDGNYSMKQFEKVFVHSHESVKVTFPIDQYTFRYFDEETQCYGVRSGTYLLYCGRFQGDAIFETEVTLNASIDNPEGFTYSVSEYDDSFCNTTSKETFRKEHERMSFGKKLTLAILVSVYYYGLVVFLLILTLRNYPSIPVFIVLGVLTLLYTAGLVVFLVFAVKNRKQKPVVDENGELSEMLDKMGEYNVELHEAFTEPVKEEEPIPEEKNPYDEEESETEKAEEEMPSSEDVAALSAEETAEDSESIESPSEENTPIEEEAESSEPEEEPSKPSEPEEDVLDYSDSDDEYYDENEAKKIEARNHIFDAYGNKITDTLKYSDSIALGDIATDFAKYAETRGIAIEMESSRALFAALAASHMIILKCSEKDLSVKLIEALENYLGNDQSFYISRLYNNYEMFHDLIWDLDLEGNYVPTDLLNFLINITALPNHLNIMAFTHVDMTTLNRYFRPFIRYAASPLDQHKLDLQVENVDYVIPKNLITILVPEDENYLETMPNVFLGSSVSLNLKIHECLSDAEYQQQMLSYPHFTDIVRMGRNQYYLNEDEWKKLDDFEEELGAFEPHFKIGNKKTIAIEKMAAVLLASQADRDETMDTVFAANLVPALKKTKLYATAGGDESIRNLVIKIFGADAMPKTLLMLVKPEMPVAPEEPEVTEPEASEIPQEQLTEENEDMAMEASVEDDPMEAEEAKEEETTDDSKTVLKDLPDEILPDEETTDAAPDEAESKIPEDNASLEEDLSTENAEEREPDAISEEEEPSEEEYQDLPDTLFEVTPEDAVPAEAVETEASLEDAETEVPAEDAETEVPAEETETKTPAEETENKENADE